MTESVCWRCNATEQPMYFSMICNSALVNRQLISGHMNNDAVQCKHRILYVVQLIVEHPPGPA